MIVWMDIADIGPGALASLPDGSRIRIEIVHPDGYVSARPVEGEFEGLLVVCAISKLGPEPEESVFSKLKCPVLLASEMSGFRFLVFNHLSLSSSGGSVGKSGRFLA
jgi:hypothetical protein